MKSHLLRAPFATLAVSLLLGACAIPPARLPDARVAELRTSFLAFEQGLRRYEEGAFEQAALWLDEALALGLEPREDAVRAHKLRAFIECAAGRMGACKSHFRAALKLDPGFDLARAEAGHPMWGPAFREVRGETSAQPSR